jgi:hypothetical protein
VDYQLAGSGDQTYIECLPGGGVIASEQDALDLVGACGEYGTQRLLLYAGNLPPAFYDLKTGLAGAVLLKLSNYWVKTAAVLTPELVGNGRFSEFVLEANRSGRLFRVFYEREKAVEWLLKE